MGKLILFAGLGIAAVGLLVMAAGKIPYIGRLPGDIFIKKGNTSFYFPLTTSILLSVLLSLGAMLIQYLRK